MGLGSKFYCQNPRYAKIKKGELAKFYLNFADLSPLALH
jgi:hypothetical protein